MANIAYILADNVSTWRKSRGMTQESLAEACDISVQTVRAVENSLRWPGIETIQAIAKALKIEEGILFSAAFKVPDPVATTPHEALRVLTTFVERFGPLNVSPAHQAIADILPALDNDEALSVLSYIKSRAEAFDSSASLKPGKKTQKSS